MDMEKFTSGKVYLFFEWFFKLVIWNLLSLLIMAVFACIPTICFYKIQNDYSINEIRMENNQVYVILNNDNETMVGDFPQDLTIKNIRCEEDYIYLDVEDITIAVPNDEEYIELDEEKTYFNEDKELILYGMKKETNCGKILDSVISIELSKIDINNNVVVSLENGIKLNYGNKIETKSGLSGALIIIAILLALFAFIPCFVTIFSMVKIFAEDGSTSTFVLFFDRLWDNFKSLYKVELIIIPAVFILSFALYFYYRIINSLNYNGFFYTFSYSIILITLLVLILWLVNLPMTLGYFRMKTFTIMKFTLVMTFKNILFTFLYVIILVIPIVLCLFNGFLIPIWFLVGFSLPELVIYLLSAKKYRYLVHNIETYKEDDIYELEGNE